MVSLNEVGGGGRVTAADGAGGLGRTMGRTRPVPAAVAPYLDVGGGRARLTGEAATLAGPAD